MLFRSAFVDISLGGENGLELAGVIKVKQPACKVKVLSMHLILLKRLCLICLKQNLFLVIS